MNITIKGWRLTLAAMRDISFLPPQWCSVASSVESQLAAPNLVTVAAAAAAARRQWDSVIGETGVTVKFLPTTVTWPQSLRLSHFFKHLPLCCAVWLIIFLTSPFSPLTRGMGSKWWFICFLYYYFVYLRKGGLRYILFLIWVLPFSKSVTCSGVTLRIIQLTRLIKEWISRKIWWWQMDKEPGDGHQFHSCTGWQKGWEWKGHEITSASLLVKSYTSEN